MKIRNAEIKEKKTNMTNPNKEDYHEYPKVIENDESNFQEKEKSKAQRNGQSSPPKIHLTISPKMKQLMNKSNAKTFQGTKQPYI